MAEETLEQKHADALRRIETLTGDLEAAKSTIAKLEEQIETLRDGAGGLDALPDHVKADALDRMAAGLTRDVAIERALHQERHNKNLAAAQAEADEAAALEAAEPKAETAPKRSVSRSLATVIAKEHSAPSTTKKAGAKGK